MIRNRTRGRMAMVLVAVCGGSIGCDIPHRPEFRASETAVSKGNGGSDLGISGSEASKRPALPLDPAEFRFGIKEGPAMANQSFVGDQTLQITRNEERFGQPSSSTIAMKRRIWLRNGNLQLIDRLEISEEQDDYGEVLGWTVLRQQGPWLKKIQGSVEGGSMKIESVAGRTERTRAIKWPAGDRGFFVEQSVFMRDDLTNGQVFGPIRTLRIQSGDRLVEPVSAMISSAGKIRVTVDKELKTLPEVITSFQAKNQVIAEQTSYVDEAGWPLRSVDQDNYVAMRVSDDRDLSLDPEPVHDIEVRTVGQPWPSDSNAPVYLRIRSLGTLSDEVLFESIPDAERQNVRVEESAVLVRLNPMVANSRAVSKQDSTAPLLSPPKKDDLKSSKMADHMHPAVRKVATAATRGMATEDVDRVTESIARTTWGIIELTERFNGLVPASRVAVNLSSDAFGRASLAAAMLRSKGIHTRLAMGPAVRDGRTTFHAWPVVFLNGQWRPLDEDLKRTDRLTLAITDYDFQTVQGSIEQVLSTLGAIEIDVISSDALPRQQAMD